VLNFDCRKLQHSLKLSEFVTKRSKCYKANVSIFSKQRTMCFSKSEVE